MVKSNLKKFYDILKTFLLKIMVILIIFKSLTKWKYIFLYHI